MFYVMKTKQLEKKISWTLPGDEDRIKNEIE